MPTLIELLSQQRQDSAVDPLQQFLENILRGDGVADPSGSVPTTAASPVTPDTPEAAPGSLLEVVKPKELTTGQRVGLGISEGIKRALAIDQGRPLPTGPSSIERVRAARQSRADRETRGNLTKEQIRQQEANRTSAEKASSARITSNEKIAKGRIDLTRDEIKAADRRSKEALVGRVVFDSAVARADISDLRAGLSSGDPEAIAEAGGRIAAANEEAARRAEANKTDRFTQERTENTIDQLAASIHGGIIDGQLIPSLSDKLDDIKDPAEKKKTAVDTLRALSAMRLRSFTPDGLKRFDQLMEDARAVLMPIISAPAQEKKRGGGFVGGIKDFFGDDNVPLMAGKLGPISGPIQESRQKESELQDLVQRILNQQ